MSDYTKHNGYSLIELLIVVIFVGIIAALTIPSIVGLLNRIRVNNALQTLEGAIKETQRQAIRHKKLCRIIIDTNSNILRGNSSDCLLSDREINNNIFIRTNLRSSPPNIAFSSKGNTNTAGTIVLFSNDTNTRRCFVIGLGLGISRTGNYSRAIDSTNPNPSISGSNCKR